MRKALLFIGALILIAVLRAKLAADVAPLITAASDSSHSSSQFSSTPFSMPINMTQVGSVATPTDRTGTAVVPVKNDDLRQLMELQYLKQTEIETLQLMQSDVRAQSSSPGFEIK